MNWRTSLRFPSRPRISRECQQLIEALICEKEDRIGSRRLDSVSRPNSVIVQNRQQAAALGGGGGGMSKGLEGADAIKAHPWFADIDFATIHLKTPPFVPQLKSPESTKYFEDNIDDNTLPAPDAGLGGEITRDPLLKNKEEGAALLDVRKQLAFQVSCHLFTFIAVELNVLTGMDVQETEESPIRSENWNSEFRQTSRLASCSRKESITSRRWVRIRSKSLCLDSVFILRLALLHDILCVYPFHFISRLIYLRFVHSCRRSHLPI